MLKKEAAYPRQSSGERKLNLYDDIIDYFDKGKVSYTSALTIQSDPRVHVMYLINKLPYTRIFSSDKNFEGLNYVGINFRGFRTTC